MNKILVTGATGFIGKHLVLKLRNEGNEVIGINSTNGDIAEEATWLNLPSAEVVIHLAASTFVPASWENPETFLKTNLLGTISALNYCKRYGARMVFLSSYLYGNPDKLPISETAELRPNNPYALSKKMAEDACEFYSKYHGINITILRPFNVYGPGQTGNFLIPSIIKQIISGISIYVKDLDPKRDYIYIDDLINAIIKASKLQDRFNVFNIGTGKSYSVAELIELIQRILCKNLPIHSSNERRPEEIMDTVADISKAVNFLNWQPQWTLEEGIRSISFNFKEDRKS